MNNKYEHITKDIGEAAALLTRGCEVISIQWKDQTAYFVFNNPAASSISNDYFFTDHLKVSPREYFENLRMLKRKILSNKNIYRNSSRSR